jgi:hypothetical protein
VRGRGVGAGRPRVLRRAAAPVVLASAVSLALATSLGAATVTIGQLGADAGCQPGFDFVQLGPTSTFAAPPGNWNVISWSTEAGDGTTAAGSLQLEMWRPTATPNVFMLVGISPVVTTTASGVNTFSLASPIAVQGGDLLGLRNITPGYGCVRLGVSSGSPGGAFNATAPAPGDLRTLPPLPGPAEFNAQATLQSPPPPPPPAATVVVVTPRFTG